MTVKAAVFTSVYDNCQCPISAELMKDPVIDACGHTFERSAIQRVFNKATREGKPALCPLSRLPISEDRLVVNLAVKDLAKEMEGCHFSPESQMLIAMMAQVIRQNKAIIRQNAELRFDNQLQQVRYKQLQSVANMNIAQRIGVMIGCVEIEAIREQDLTDQDRRVLEREEDRAQGIDIFAEGAEQMLGGQISPQEASSPRAATESDLLHDLITKEDGKKRVSPMVDIDLSDTSKKTA